MYLVSGVMSSGSTFQVLNYFFFFLIFIILLVWVCVSMFVFTCVYLLISAHSHKCVSVEVRGRLSGITLALHHGFLAIRLRLLGLQNKQITQQTISQAPEVLISLQHYCE